MDSRQLQLVLQLQDNASRELRKIVGELGNAEGQAKSTSTMFGSMAKSIAAVATAYISVRSAYNALSLGVKVAADMQTAEIGLKTLLGSADKAHATIERLKKEAARTPFELPGLTQATQLLTSVTKDGNKSIDIILNIGEGLAAMGKGQSELDRIIVNLQQIASVGHAATIDIKQFAFAGIPIYEMLAETTGKTGDELGKLIENGGVTFDVLTKMFDDANNSGGRFFNAYVNQSGSFNQASSNMKDSFGIMMADMVTNSGLFDGITKAMVDLAGVMTNYKTIASEVKNNFVEMMASFDEKTLIITHVKAAFAEIADTYNIWLKPALAELGTKMVELQPLWEAMGTVLGFTVVAAIHVLVVVLKGLVGLFVFFLTIVTEIVNYILGVFIGAIDTLSTTFAVIAALLKGDVSGAFAILKDNMSGLFDWFTKLIEKAEKFISLLGQMGGDAISFVKDKLSGKRAVGGSVAGGGSYMVGENGPEIFRPNGNGRIVPNYALSGGMGGGAVFNFYGDVTGEEIVDKVSDALMSRINNRIRT